MNLHDLFLILHLLLFCYWLGGDIGVFYSSGFAANPKLSIEARMMAARIMQTLDLVPRLCSAVMLTVGGVLGEFVGVTHPMWQMVGIISLAPIWLALELILHFKHGTPLGKAMQKFDNPFKWAIIIACIASVSWSFASGHLDEAPWVGYKILVFAAIVFCSLVINKTIGPFIVGIECIAAGAINDEQNAAMGKSLKQCKWAVLAIWTGLIIEAFLGVVQPGG